MPLDRIRESWKQFVERGLEKHAARKRRPESWPLQSEFHIGVCPLRGVSDEPRCFALRELGGLPMLSEARHAHYWGAALPLSQIGAVPLCSGISLVEIFVFVPARNREARKHARSGLFPRWCVVIERACAGQPESFQDVVLTS